MPNIKHVKNVICPFHHDINPSLSIYEVDGNYFYKCFGCGKKGNLSKQDIFLDLIDAIETYDVTSVDGKFENIKHMDTEFLNYIFKQKYKYLDDKIVKRYGIRHDSDSWRLYIPLYDEDRRIWGRQIKYERRSDGQPKYHLAIFRKGIHASVFYKSELTTYRSTMRYFVVESVLDGLILLSLNPELDSYIRETAFIAILGTKLHDSVIYNFMMKQPLATFTFSFDSDAKPLAFLYAHHLRVLGINTDLFLPEDGHKVYETKTFKHITF